MFIPVTKGGKYHGRSSKGGFYVLGLEQPHSASAQITCTRIYMATRKFSGALEIYFWLFPGSREAFEFFRVHNNPCHQNLVIFSSLSSELLHRKLVQLICIFITLDLPQCSQHVSIIIKGRIISANSYGKQ